MTAPVRHIRNRISEDQLQSAVIDVAQMFGWRVVHFRPARNATGWSTPIQGDPGFPDLVMARNGVVLLVELKSDTGKLSRDQEEWQQAAGSLVWRPEQWLDGTVQKVLA